MSGCGSTAILVILQNPPFLTQTPEVPWGGARGEGPIQSWCPGPEPRALAVHCESIAWEAAKEIRNLIGAGKEMICSNTGGSFPVSPRRRSVSRHRAGNRLPPCIVLSVFGRQRMHLHGGGDPPPASAGQGQVQPHQVERAGAGAGARTGGAGDAVA